MEAREQVVSVGLESWGIYIPKERHSAAYMSQKSGIPQEILKTKFGLESKTIAGPDDHNVTMALKASLSALERANIAPTDIDVVIWAGEVYDKYLMQTYGIKLQNEIGATNAWAFDVNQRCGTFMLAINLVKGLMATDKKINRVLIASGYRNCDLIDYENPRSRFMINLGASGAAIVLTRDYPKNILLGSVVITDGCFADDVVVLGGGSGLPMTNPGGGDAPATAYKVLTEKLNYLDVPDPEGMKKRLDKLSMSNFIKVVNSALEESGCKKEDIDYLGLLHMKKSAFEYVSGELGVDVEKQTTYYDEFVHLGHMGQNDGVMSIDFGLKHNKIKDGYLVVLAAAGIGYSWGATCIRWG
ncbi:3-oxoacyl-ACP synthase [bacterium]|nr:3-oxoacyl-ACP synthase [bacterium]